MVSREGLELLVNDGFPLEAHEESTAQTMCRRGACLIPDQLIEEEYAKIDHDGDLVHTFDCSDEVVIGGMQARSIDEAMEEVEGDDDESLLQDDGTPEMGCAGDHEEPCGSECILNDD